LTWVETCVMPESLSAACLAKPKSATLARKFSVRRMFEDFMSLWMIGWSTNQTQHTTTSDSLSSFYMSIEPQFGYPLREY